jgi:hypothetical protein
MLDASKRILELYEDNESQIYIIEGWNGHGKSSYANTIISEVYSKDGINPNWSIPLFREHLGFHPMSVLKKWKIKHKNAKTFQLHPNDLVFHWDDAGAWLHSLDYNNPYVKQVGKYLQIFRTDWACIIFSCIDADDLTKKIRGLSSAITIKITKHSSHTHKYRRIATAKHVEKDWYNNVYWKDDWTEGFNCKMPDTFFSWYDPIRRRYAYIVKKMMDKAAQEEPDIVKTYKKGTL